ncbi:MAG: thiamine diphosphokinase, partial [Spirochaetia bacterium]
MTGILLIGGKAPGLKSVEKILTQADCVVAADSGFDLAQSYGIVPDIVIGDMDSVSGGEAFYSFPDEKKLTYPEDKDETDTELGLEVLERYGCRK